MANLLQLWNWLDNRRSEDDEVSGGVWKAVETEVGEIRMAKAKRGKSERNESRRKKEKNQKKKGK